MSHCSFSLATGANAAELIGKANEAVVKTGGIFTGDADQGGFELKTPLGTVKGNYTVLNNTISMVITHKPVFLSCSRIEEELRRHITP